MTTLWCLGNLTVDEAVRDGVSDGFAMGGDAAFAALAARLELDDVHMVAPVGGDLPDAVVAELRDAGVRIGDLPRRSVGTIRNRIDYAADCARVWTMLTPEEDFETLSVQPDDVPAEALAADGIVLLAMTLEAQLRLTPWLRARTGATLYLDLQEDYLDARAELLALIASCDVFLPSEVEAIALAGTTDLVRAAETFRDAGARTVVIKRAEQGCLVLEGDRLVEVPADVVEPIDSTGAGDAFCGAFAAAHLLTGDAVAAAHAGAAAAREAVLGPGTRGILRAARARTGAGR
jgi:ribokinase